MKISFADRETGNKLLRLEYNKKTKLVKYHNKWINPKIIYKKGYQDANIHQECNHCEKKLDNYSWYCDECKTRNQRIFSQIIGEVSEVLK